MSREIFQKSYRFNIFFSSNISMKTFIYWLGAQRMWEVIRDSKNDPREVMIAEDMIYLCDKMMDEVAEEVFTEWFSE
jgi:hypothetical protein